MIKMNHLAKYQLVLTTRSPVFIGSGIEVTKKEYYYDHSKKHVHILNLEKFIRLIVDKELSDAYEAYVLRGASRVYLADFLREHRINRAEIAAITDYIIDSADALPPEHSLKGIKLFMRNACQQPYIPGSSLKGALRTALLVKMLHEDGDKRKLNADQFWTATKDRPGDRNNAKRAVEQIEENYINTLGLNRRNGDAVNSLMRGISVSDSQPIRDIDAMILCGKNDLSITGNIKPLNVVRECLRPGVKVSFDLCLDSSILKKIDIDYIQSAIRDFGAYYAENFDSKFKKPVGAVAEKFQDTLILGGGAGFFSKTIVYALLGQTRGLKFVSDYMQNQFRQHKHEMDLETGISPHRLKHTAYRRQSYHYGVCGVEIL
jgi:CRISPR-associated protein Csm5